jgi:hypothetical protein
MLIEAEKERLKDTMECEEHTRCKVGKGNTRCPIYEYTDIDAEKTVSAEEYKTKYVKFLNNKRGSHQPDVSKNDSIFRLSMYVENLTGYTDSMASTTFSSQDIKKHSRRRGRREKLSPCQFKATMNEVRDISFKEDQVLHNKNARVIGSMKEVEYDTGEDSNFRSPDTETDESKKHYILGTNYVSTLPPEKRGYFMKSSRTNNIMPKIYYNYSTEHTGALKEYLEAQVQHEESDSHIQELGLQNIHEMNALPISQRFLKSIFMRDEVGRNAKELAEYRLQMRYDTIIWKYHWEVTSAHAAMVASKRLS